MDRNARIVRIKAEVKKAVNGKDDVICRMLCVILAGGHVLLEDVPGVGKTTLVLALAKSLSVKFQRVQFTPDTMPSDVTGFSVYNRSTGALEFKPGPVFTNIFLGDELNRTSARTQAALLEVMEEHAVTMDGGRYEVEEPFIVIATQNPLGAAGTSRLPESQLDRFMVCLSLGYPDAESQKDMMRNRLGGNPLDRIVPAVTGPQFLEMKREVQRVYVSEELMDYIVGLCEATRKAGGVRLGISPRGGLAVFHMARSHAYMSGRDYVNPEDVKAVFLDVCSHRMLLEPQSKIEGLTSERILKRVLREVKAPCLTDHAEEKR